MGTLLDRLKANRERLEDVGAATKIDRSKPEGIARKLGWLSKPKNRDVEKRFNEGANNR